MNARILPRGRRRGARDLRYSAIVSVVRLSSTTRKQKRSSPTTITLASSHARPRRDAFARLAVLADLGI
jgi:hypothetical protein